MLSFKQNYYVWCLLFGEVRIQRSTRNRLVGCVTHRTSCKAIFPFAVHNTRGCGKFSACFLLLCTLKLLRSHTQLCVILCIIIFTHKHLYPTKPWWFLWSSSHKIFGIKDEIICEWVNDCSYFIITGIDFYMCQSIYYWSVNPVIGSPITQSEKKSREYRKSARLFTYMFVIQSTNLHGLEVGNHFWMWKRLSRSQPKWWRLHWLDFEHL